MADSKQPVDVLWFVEHVARELDAACAVAQHLTARHGRSIEIASLVWGVGSVLRRFQPRVVALPYCYGAGDFGTRRVLPVWPGAVYVNLAFEQINQRINRDFKAPRDPFARSHVLHHAWGAFYAACLREHGVPPAHIAINGNPSYTLYRPPYRAFYPTREALARRHGLDPAKRWVFLPEHYAAAFFSDGLLRDYVRRGYTAEQADGYRRFAAASFHEAVRWWYAAAGEGIEVIIRPRPATPLARFLRACRAAAGGGPPRGLHVLKAGTVKEWILASDQVASSYSTTLIEAAVAGKPVAMVVPVALPDFLDADWYRHVPQFTLRGEFLEWVRRGPAEPHGQTLKLWAEQMMGNGDAIAGLADLLDRACGVGPLPDPVPASAIEAAVQAQRPSGDGVRAQARAWLSQAKRSVWRRESLHEQDDLAGAQVRARLARWAQVLDAEPAGILEPSEAG